MVIEIEARKEIRKFVNRLLRDKSVKVIMLNKLDSTFLNEEAVIVSSGQKIIIETFENPLKVVSRNKKTEKKI